MFLLLHIEVNNARTEEGKDGVKKGGNLAQLQVSNDELSLSLFPPLRGLSVRDTNLEREKLWARNRRGKRYK